MYIIYFAVMLAGLKSRLAAIQYKLVLDVYLNVIRVAHSIYGMLKTARLPQFFSEMKSVKCIYGWRRLVAYPDNVDGIMLH